MIFDNDSIIEHIKKQTENKPVWVGLSRQNHKILKALVTGEGFKEVLIERIEHIESEARASARKKYSKDIRDLFFRVMSKRQNVFDANGGSETNNINNETLKELFKKKLSNFKSNKSLYKWLSESYFNLADVDPNGVILTEYNKEEKIYPVYKSIDDIYNYKSNGQLVEWIIFEPEIKEGIDLKLWRIIDENTDWLISQIGETFTVLEDKTFNHPFKEVPIIILSEKEVLGTELRQSNIEPVVELAKDYARDKSTLTIYKFQKGHPTHWRFVSQCNTCKGTAKTGDGTVCKSCDGKGYLTKGDVTDMVTLPIPKEGQPNIAPNIAGYVSPDLETWKQYKEDLRDMENLIEDTIWGTDKTHQTDVNNETATGRFIDIQPITNSLNSFSDTAEYVYNTMAKWILMFIDKTETKDYYYRSFGRRYIIENPDVLLEKYNTAKKEGDANTILDKMLEEIILSKYKNDPKNQALLLKKASIEPYIHLTIEQVNDIFGNAEAQKKVLFQEFWQTTDKTKDKEKLKEEFNIFVSNNLKTIKND